MALVGSSISIQGWRGIIAEFGPIFILNNHRLRTIGIRMRIGIAISIGINVVSIFFVTGTIAVIITATATVTIISIIIIRIISSIIMCSVHFGLLYERYSIGSIASIGGSVMSICLFVTQ